MHLDLIILYLNFNVLYLILLFLLNSMFLHFNLLFISWSNNLRFYYAFSIINIQKFDAHRINTLFFSYVLQLLICYEF